MTEKTTGIIALTTQPRFTATSPTYSLIETTIAATSTTLTSVSKTITTRRRKSSSSTINLTKTTAITTTPTLFKKTTTTAAKTLFSTQSRTSLLIHTISTTSRRSPDSETSTKTATTPKTSTATSTETTTASLINAMEDHFCENFDCIISVEPAEQCFDYIKTIDDINCHLFCQLDNCTKVPTTDTYCPIYTCWPHSTTTSTTKSTTSISTTSSSSTSVPDHDIQIIIGSCLGSVIAIIFIGLILFLGISLYKRRQQQNESIVHDNEANTDHHFVATTPSHSSSEDLDNDSNSASSNNLRTRSSIFYQPDLILEEAEFLLNQVQAARTASLASKLHEPHDSTQVEKFEMSTFKKRMLIPSNGFETTAC